MSYRRAQFALWLHDWSQSQNQNSKTNKAVSSTGVVATLKSLSGVKFLLLTQPGPLF